MSKKFILFSLAVFFCFCDVLILVPNVFAANQEEYRKELGKQLAQIEQLYHSCTENCYNGWKMCDETFEACRGVCHSKYHLAQMEQLYHSCRENCYNAWNVCDDTFEACKDVCLSKYRPCFIPGMFAPRGELPYATQEGCEWRRAN